MSSSKAGRVLARPWVVMGCVVLVGACTEPAAQAPPDATPTDPPLVACPGDDGCAVVGASQCTPAGLRRCLIANGTCAAWSAPAPCDDGNPCTVDQCDETGCAHTPRECDDDKPCTVDGCDAVTGACVHDGTGCDACMGPADCDDQNPCTDDTCANGICTWTERVCDDGDGCTVDACQAGSGCVSVPKVCEDGNACTVDACVGGECTVKTLSCDDGNACTDDVCDPEAGCLNTPRNCDDGNPCTKDGCAAVTGACVHAQIPSCGLCSDDGDCDDGSQCTEDVCADGACVWTDADCDDGDACTEDTCHAVNGCVYGPVSCDDGDPCTTTACDSEVGCQSTPVTCDDGDACTEDTCLKGYGCAALTPVSCNDGDPCTKDSCTPDGGCTHAPVPCAAPVKVVVSGDMVVQANKTMTLSASTDNGEDPSYTWSSSDLNVATVQAGVVTGVAPGQATIYATGTETGAVGSMGVVVLALPGVDWTPPFWEEWLSSGHSNPDAPAFATWGGAPVPTPCARCHSDAGFKDWLGADGSAAGSVQKPAAPGVVTCTTCHNEAAAKLTEVTFPSGTTIKGLGANARCVACHKGTNAGAAVDTAIASAGAAGNHQVTPGLTFQSIHQRAAAATLYGNDVAGGYEYAGRLYDKKAWHVAEADTCTGCHEPHSTKVRVEKCAGCHTGVATVEDVRNIRMPGSAGDFDGDGDRTEGMKYELDGMADRLAQALSEYAAQKTPASLVVSPGQSPYFFKDQDGDGQVSAADVPFSAWTPALVRAAYNLAYYWNEPGAYAHNPEYMVQLLHDATEDIQAGLGQPPLTTARLDGPHVRGAVEPYRRWYKEGGVHAACSRCHTGAGFVLTAQTGANAPFPAENGMPCTSCHENAKTFELRQVNTVFYPSGVAIGKTGAGAALGPKDRVCAFCHTGRLAAADVDEMIATNKMHQVVDVHYFPAASVLHGSDAAVGYQYPDRTYAPTATHSGGCIDCHAPKATQHSMAIADNAAKCATCHGTTPPDLIRGSKLADYDGDGSSTEPLAAELDTLGEALYAQMKAFSAASGNPIIYDAVVYPHFFHDKNGDGIGQASETVYANRYVTWTPELMKATFNYRMHKVEPGAWAHNFAYMAQLLYDSIEMLGGDVESFVRP